MKLFITFWNTWINKWKLEVALQKIITTRSNTTFELIEVEVWSFDFQKRKNWSGVVEIADTMKEEENDTTNFGTMPLRHDWMWRNWTVKLWKTWHPLLNLCWASSLFSRRRNFKFLSRFVNFVSNSYLKLCVYFCIILCNINKKKNFYQFAQLFYAQKLYSNIFSKYNTFSTSILFWNCSHIYDKLKKILSIPPSTRIL